MMAGSITVSTSCWVTRPYQIDCPVGVKAGDNPGQASPNGLRTFVISLENLSFILEVGTANTEARSPKYWVPNIECGVRGMCGIGLSNPVGGSRNKY